MATYTDIEKINSFTQLWDGLSGKLIEDFITRHMVSSMKYEDQVLTLYGPAGNEIAHDLVTAMTATYEYAIKIHKVTINDKPVTLDTYFVFDDNTKVVAYVALVATSETLKKIYRTASINVNISLGSNTVGKTVISLPEDAVTLDNRNQILSINDESYLTPIDITSLFATTTELLQLTATLVPIPTLEYNDTMSTTFDYKLASLILNLTIDSTSPIVKSNIISFNLNGLNSSLYKIELYNNGKGGTGSDPLELSDKTYEGLTEGLNQIVARIKMNDTVASKWKSFDIIYAKDDYIPEKPIVAINNVATSIDNGSVTNLFTAHIYNPKGEDIEVEPFLDDISSGTNNSIGKQKFRIQDFTLGVLEKTFSIYLEDESGIKNKYLKVNVDGEVRKYYKHGIYTIENSNFYTMSVADADTRLFKSDKKALYEFDQTKTYSKLNIFVENNLNTLNVGEGWIQDEGKLAYKVTSRTQPLFKNPITFDKTNNFTLEFGLKTYNVSDITKPVITIGKLQIRPSAICWDTTIDESLTHGSLEYKTSRSNYYNRNCGFREDTNTHIIIQFIRDYSLQSLYLPEFLSKGETDVVKTLKFNLLRIFINGVIAREIKLGNSEYNDFDGLQIFPTTADINLYALRIYQSRFDYLDVLKNYISYIPNKSDKLAFYNANDILDPVTGEISFTKAKKLYNTLVYVFPKDVKFPNRSYGGENNKESDAEKTLEKVHTTLFINYADPKTDAEFGGRITHGLMKGLGSSAKRYLIWNTQFSLGKLTYEKLVTVNEVVHNEGEKIKSEFTPNKYLNPGNRFTSDAKSVTDEYVLPNLAGENDEPGIKIKKLVGKVNFASSMQSHKLGACELYNSTYSPTAQMPNPISNSRKAVKELPFLYFYVETDIVSTPENGYSELANIELADVISMLPKFMGFLTFGSGKCDDSTYGYDKKLTPEYILLEGGENEDPTCKFMVPWHELQRLESTNENKTLTAHPNVSKGDSEKEPWKNLKIYDKSIYFDADASWDIDYGIAKIDGSKDWYEFTEGGKVSLKKWREFYDFVYMYDCSLRKGTVSEINSWNKGFKYMVETNTSIRQGLNNLSVSAGDILRYDPLDKLWVPAGLFYENGKWESLNAYTLAGVESGTSLTDIVITIRNKFKEGISKYVDTNDMCHHLAFIKFVSGTDNRAKNTYFVIVGLKKTSAGENDGEANYLIRTKLDDTDTIFTTDNSGLLSKDYNLVEPPFNSDTAWLWGDVGQSVFFSSFDMCFESEIKSKLGDIMSNVVANINVADKKNNLYKWFFAIQEYYPAIAYNHTSQIYYENAQLIYDSHIWDFYDNNKGIDPITQSHGSSLEDELEFMNKRYTFLRSYANKYISNGLQLADPGAGGITDSHYKFSFTPYLDFYPTYQGTNGKSEYIIPNNNKYSYDAVENLAKTGEFYSDKEFGTPEQSLNQLIPFTSAYKEFSLDGYTLPLFTANINHVTKLELLNINLTKFLPSAPVLEELKLTGKIPSTLDLSEYLKLKKIDVKATTGLETILIPETANLESVKLPDSVKNVSVYNNPNLSELEISKNVTSLYINLDTKVNVVELLDKINSSCKVTLTNGTIELTNAQLLKILDNLTINNTVIKITDSLPFNTLTSLVDKFGTSMNASEFKKTFVYKAESVSNIIVNEQANAFDDNSKPVSISVSGGNDINIIDDGNGCRFDITYSISSKKATIDSKTGNITKNDETEDATVTTVIKYNGSRSTSKTTVVLFKWQAPKVGDFVYINGSYSSIFNSQLTMVGMVYYVDITTKTMYIVGSLELEPLVLGFGALGFKSGYNITSGTTYSEDYISKVHKVARILEESKLSGVENWLNAYTGDSNDYNDKSVTIEDTLTDVDVTKSPTVTVSGKDATLVCYKNIIKNLNSIFDGYTTLSKDNLGDLITELEKGNSNLKNSTGTDISSIIYPYVMQMYFYEPTPKGSEQVVKGLKATNWYMPSSNELSAVLYHRIKSATDSTIMSSSFDEVIADYKGSGIFNKPGASTINAWKNIVNSSGKNPVTTCVNVGNYTGMSNYLFTLGRTDTGPSASEKYLYGYATNTGPNNNYYKNSIIFKGNQYYKRESTYRMSKFVGVPFVQLKYEEKK